MVDNATMLWIVGIATVVYLLICAAYVITRKLQGKYPWGHRSGEQ